MAYLPTELLLSMILYQGHARNRGTDLAAKDWLDDIKAKWSC